MSDDTARLNSRLAEAHQYYRAIEPALTMTTGQRALLAASRRQEFAVAAYYLLEAIKEIDDVLANAVLGRAVQSAAAGPLHQYRKLLAPRCAEFEAVLNELLDLPEDEDSDAGSNAPKDPVASILETGLDYWEVSETDQFFSELELRKAERLLRSEFFRPDDWLRNASELQPVSGPDADKRLPSPVRVRLRELYHSFVLGNHLAALSLARATLEYCVHDRAGVLSIQVYSGESTLGQPRRLSRLVEDVGAKRPELVDAMRDIVECGNRVLHPRKREKVTLLPEILRRDALRAIHELREVVETIYLK